MKEALKEELGGGLAAATFPVNDWSGSMTETNEWLLTAYSLSAITPSHVELSSSGREPVAD